jgi:hypothetical protein
MAVSRRQLLAALALAWGSTAACGFLVDTNGLSGGSPTAQGDEGGRSSIDEAGGAAPEGGAGIGPSDAGDAGSIAGAANLFANGDFENGTCAPWTVSAGTLTISTALAHHGHASCRWCKAGAGPVELTPNANFAAGLVDGDQLQATGWFRWENDAGNAGSVIGGMNLSLDNDYVYSFLASNALFSSDSWQALYATRPITDYGDAGPPAKVGFGVEWDNAADGTCLVFDDFSVVKTHP